ncbi:adenylyltransferase/cytidyltransferase family protein [Candidatus Gracilibacteria bacterium]|nr:adenylyltransferase/cytidyltransferase family protein [Candidatus Gracilibacteria bacterium]
MKSFKKVFVAGTFDKFHAGHQFFLKQASDLGEEITIIIARDATVERIKGRRPIHTQEERLFKLTQEYPQAHVRLGREDGNFIETVKEESPDVLFLGYDQHIDESQFQEAFPQMKILKGEAYKPEIFKSSKF